MSDFIVEEPSAVGLKESIDLNPILEFQKDYRFISNFAEAPHMYDGDPYLCTEASYQASKLIGVDRPLRALYFNLDGKSAKQLSKVHRNLAAQIGSM